MLGLARRLGLTVKSDPGDPKVKVVRLDLTTTRQRRVGDQP